MKQKKNCAKESKQDVPTGDVNITHKGAIS